MNTLLTSRNTVPFIKKVAVVLFIFLVVSLFVRPTFYLVTILIGLLGFDLTLGIILTAINDQNKLNKRIQTAKN